MNIRIATKEDIAELIQMRILYLMDDYGKLSLEQISLLETELLSYFNKHLNTDMIAYIKYNFLPS